MSLSISVCLLLSDDELRRFFGFGWRRRMHGWSLQRCGRFGDHDQRHGMFDFGAGVINGLGARGILPTTSTPRLRWGYCCAAHPYGNVPFPGQLLPMARPPVEAEVRLDHFGAGQSEFDDFHHRQNKQRKHVLDSIEFPVDRLGYSFFRNQVHWGDRRVDGYGQYMATGFGTNRKRRQYDHWWFK